MVDTSTPSAPLLGINNSTPAFSLDISGAQQIDSNNTTVDMLTLGNTGGSQIKVAFNSVTGVSRVGVYDDPSDVSSALQGFYLQANDNLPLYLGHASAQAIRIDYTGSKPRVRIGESTARPLKAADSVLEIHNTGDESGPIVSLVNDAISNNSSCAIKFVEINTSAPTTGSWVMGYYDQGGGGSSNKSSFRVAYSGGATDATLGTNDYFSIDTSGSVNISGKGAATISSAGVPQGGGNLKVSGNIALTTGLIFDYDNMPSTDPSIKGVVYRDSNTLKISAG